MSWLTPSLRASHRPHAGQTIVLFALATIVLMGALGLVLDSGYNFAQRRAMQNAADAAAFAGARIVATNTNSGNYPVLATVQDVAKRNGVKDPTDPAQFDCWITNDALAPVQARGDGSLPSGGTGVQVTVRETYETFVMKVLGTPTSSTGATATARVELLAEIVGGPFTVCSINTTLSGGGTYGIFKNASSTYPLLRPAGFSSCGSGGGTPCDKTQESTDPNPPNANSEPVENDEIYYYSYLEEFLADPIDYDDGGGVRRGKTFYIHGPSNVASCNITANSFKGINMDAVNVTFPQGKDYYPPFTPGSSLGKEISLTPGNVASVSATVEGVNGCIAGATINDRVIFLPVIDNSGHGGTSPGGGAVQVGLRKLMAFYVQETGSGNAHTGRLVKNYTAQGAGTVGFVPGTADALTIHLVK